MNSSIEPGLTPPLPGLEKEEPELAQEDDIPRDDRPEAADEPAGTPTPAEAPKSANPEPLQEAVDPEKGRVKAPDPGKPEHPTQ